MADVHLRGDLTRTKPPSSDPKAAKVSSTSISIGRCTVVATGSVIKPPGRISRGVFTYYPMKIGDNVFIGISLPLLLHIFYEIHVPKLI
jgi:dynactin-5